MTTLLATETSAPLSVRGAACLGTLVWYIEEDLALWSEFDKSARVASASHCTQDQPEEHANFVHLSV